MPLVQDITLNGVPYTVVPGSYKRKGAVTGAAPILGREENPTRVKRLVLDGFGRGQRQAFRVGDDDAGAGWDSVGVGPAFDGQGVEPFPHVAAFGDSMADTPTTSLRAHGVIAGNNAFIGLGRRIYKSVALGNGVWGALTVAADLGAGFTISGLAYYQDDLLVMLSTGQDIRKFNTVTNSLTVWRTGEKGQVGVGYAGQLDLCAAAGQRPGGAAAVRDALERQRGDAPAVSR